MEPAPLVRFGSNLEVHLLNPEVGFASMTEVVRQACQVRKVPEAVIIRARLMPYIDQDIYLIARPLRLFAPAARDRMELR